MNRRNRDNMTPLDMVKGHDSDIADLLRGDDALLDASKKGDLDRVKKLLNKDNINCRDEHGRNSTPLHLAGTTLSYLAKVLVSVSLFKIASVGVCVCMCSCTIVGMCYGAVM